MSFAYYADKLSENLYETPEQFLISPATPIARTGYQDYRPSEIGVQSDEPTIRVYRRPSEVFSPETIASFNGKSITRSHPDRFLDSSNNGAHQRGHLTNVRRGDKLSDGNEALIADLIITEGSLIADVKSKQLRELSSGYSCSYIKNDAGEWEQRDIRGNHVALVPNGRAGSAVAIRDQAIELEGLTQAIADEQRTVGAFPPVIAESLPAPQAVVADSIIRESPEKPKKEKRTMPAQKGNILSRMIAALVKDEATQPEELDAAIEFATKAKERAEKEAGDGEPVTVLKPPTDRKGKDAEEEENPFKKKYEDAAAELEEYRKDAEELKRTAEKEEADRAADAEAMELHPDLKKACDHISHVKDCMDAVMEHLGVEKPGSEEEDEGLIPITKTDPEDRTKNPIPNAAKPTGDSVSFDRLKMLRPLIAESNDAAAKAAFNDLFAAARPGAHARGANGHAAILSAKRPDGVRQATDSRDPAAKAAALQETEDAFEATRKRLQGVN